MLDYQKKKKYIKTNNIIAYIVMIIFGIAFFAVSIFIISRPNDTVYEETNGTIVEIVEEYNHIDEMYEYKVYVDYEVDGVKYENVEYGSYDSSMKEGDIVKILYDVEDPSFIQAPGAENVPYIIMVVGAVITLIGVALLIRSLKKE